MAITHGMNIAEVERIGGQLTKKAGDIQTVISNVDTLLSQALQYWVGPDSKKFDALWKSHRPKMLALKNDLDDLAQKAKKNAASQRVESSKL